MFTSAQKRLHMNWTLRLRNLMASETVFRSTNNMGSPSLQTTAIPREISRASKNLKAVQNQKPSVALSSWPSAPVDSVESRYSCMSCGGGSNIDSSWPQALRRLLSLLKCHAEVRNYKSRWHVDACSNQWAPAHNKFVYMVLHFFVQSRLLNSFVNVSVLHRRSFRRLPADKDCKAKQSKKTHAERNSDRWVLLSKSKTRWKRGSTVLYGQACYIR